MLVSFRVVVVLMVVVMRLCNITAAGALPGKSTLPLQTNTIAVVPLCVVVGSLSLVVTVAVGVVAVFGKLAWGPPGTVVAIGQGVDRTVSVHAIASDFPAARRFWPVCEQGV